MLPSDDLKKEKEQKEEEEKILQTNERDEKLVKEMEKLQVVDDEIICSNIQSTSLNADDDFEVSFPAAVQEVIYKASSLNNEIDSDDEEDEYKEDELIEEPEEELFRKFYPSKRKVRHQGSSSSSSTINNNNKPLNNSTIKKEEDNVQSTTRNIITNNNIPITTTIIKEENKENEGLKATSSSSSFEIKDSFIITPNTNEFNETIEATNNNNDSITTITKGLTTTTANTEIALKEDDSDEAFEKIADRAFHTLNSKLFFKKITNSETFLFNSDTIFNVIQKNRLEKEIKLFLKQIFKENNIIYFSSLLPNQHVTMWFEPCLNFIKERMK